MVEIALDCLGSTDAFGDHLHDFDDPDPATGTGDPDLHSGHDLVRRRHGFAVDLHVAGAARRCGLGPRREETYGPSPRVDAARGFRCASQLPTPLPGSMPLRTFDQ